MQQNWLRITMKDGVVIGRLDVPPRCPHWFLKEAKERCEAYGRKMTPNELMDEIDPKEWVDILCSHNQLIPLRRPLAPEQQEEFVLFPPGSIEKFHDDFERILKDAGQDAANGWRRNIPAHIEKYGILTIEQRHKVPPAEAQKWMMVPYSKAFGVQGRSLVVYQPLVDQTGLDKDVEDLTKLVSGNIVLINELGDSKKWEDQASNHYGQGIQLTGTVTGQPV